MQRTRPKRTSNWWLAHRRGICKALLGGRESTGVQIWYPLPILCNPECQFKHYLLENDRFIPPCWCPPLNNIDPIILHRLCAWFVPWTRWQRRWGVSLSELMERKRLWMPCWELKGGLLQGSCYLKRIWIDSNKNTQTFHGWLFFPCLTPAGTWEGFLCSASKPVSLIALQPPKVLLARNSKGGLELLAILLSSPHSSTHLVTQA